MDVEHNGPTAREADKISDMVITVTVAIGTGTTVTATAMAIGGIAMATVTGMRTVVISSAPAA